MTEEYKKRDISEYREEVERDHAIRAHDRNKEEQNAFLKATLDTSVLAIRTLILVNGGAVIALLAFIGAVESSEGAKEFNSTYLVWPLSFFASGVAAGAATSLLAYIVNLKDFRIARLTKHTWEHPYVVALKKAGGEHTARGWFYGFALFFATVSLFTFIAGIVAVTFAILNSGI